ncbi:TonB-dependent siderophore receptor [Marivibrio halodurans]|uniref:TonB-dependent siderophore receptor n=1 Tax=Marivibrio halodurans TaxID=2039722 RepID=A0A8J7S0K7_9PROT|nr:TonB-dependent siderophore receptor [Marivibrio halodurans]MBP5856453.1 TonB-dependent siderophore receptor [Marivibrio halodurans]
MNCGIEQQPEGTGHGATLRVSLAIATALSATALSIVVAVPPARAQAVDGQVQVVQLSNEKAFDLPSQPLTTALTQFGQQSGMQVTVHGTLPRDLTAPAVRGPMTSEEALNRLLAGSGLIYTRSDDATVAIERPSDNNGSAIVLDPITVEGSTLRDPGQTEGTGSYAGSQVSVGSKIPTSIRETPQSVSVVTRQLMEDRNYTSLEDAMRQTTGMNVVRTDETRSPVYSRGFEVDTFQYDGVTVRNDNSFGKSLDLYTYDRVEVLRGPSGLFQGSGEPGGAINFVRKRPLDDFAYGGAARVGSWNYYRGEADVTGPLTDNKRVRGRIVAAYEDREYFYDVARKERPVLYGTIEADITESTTLSVGSTYQQDDAVISYGLPTFDNGELLDVDRSTFIGADWNRYELETVSTFADIEHSFDDGAKLQLTTRYVDRSAGGKYAFSLGGGADPNTGLVQLHGQKFNSKQEDISIDAHGYVPLQAFGQTQKLLGGFDYKYSDFDKNYWDSGIFASTNVYAPRSDIPEPNFVASSASGLNTEQYGLYGQARLKPTGWLTGIFGGRLSWWQSEARDNLIGQTTSDTSIEAEGTPYAAIVIDANDAASFYGSYASIFQPQTATTVAGDVLPPRVGDQYEAGVKIGLFNDNLIGHLAAFQVQDQNRALSDPNNPGFSISAGEVRSRGIEAEISGSPAEGWQLLTGYAYTESEYIKGSASQTGTAFRPTIPKHVFNLWARYKFYEGPLEGLSIGGGGKVASSFFVQSGNLRIEEDGYVVANAQLGYDLTEDASVSLSVNNILDETYYEKLQGTSLGNRFGEPRSFWLTLRKNF